MFCGATKFAVPVVLMLLVPTTAREKYSRGKVTTLDVESILNTRMCRPQVGHATRCQGFTAPQAFKHRVSDDYKSAIVFKFVRMKTPTCAYNRSSSPYS